MVTFDVLREIYAHDMSIISLMLSINFYITASLLPDNTETDPFDHVCDHVLGIVIKYLYNSIIN